MVSATVNPVDDLRGIVKTFHSISEAGASPIKFVCILIDSVDVRTFFKEVIDAVGRSHKTLHARTHLMDQHESTLPAPIHTHGKDPPLTDLLDVLQDEGRDEFHRFLLSNSVNGSTHSV